MDRVLGILMALLAIFSWWHVFGSFSVSWAWAGLLIWTIVISSWTRGGVKDIPIGWRGKATFLEGRVSGSVPEGKRWVPWPLGVVPVDCRKKVLELPPLESITSDGVKVFVGGAVAYRIDHKHLDQNLEVDPADLKRWIETTREEAIRIGIRRRTQSQAFDAHQKLGEDVTIALKGPGQPGEARTSEHRWGVEIIETLIPQVSPDPAIAADLADQAREVLQRKGQEVQAAHMAHMFKFFSGSDRINPTDPNSETGPNLPPALAYKAALLAVNKATPEALASNTFTLDPATINAIVTAVGGLRR